MQDAFATDGAALEASGTRPTDADVATRPESHVFLCVEADGALTVGVVRGL